MGEACKGGQRSKSGGFEMHIFEMLSKDSFRRAEYGLLYVYGCAVLSCEFDLKTARGIEAQLYTFLLSCVSAHLAASRV